MTTSTMRMKMLGSCLGLCIFLSSCSALPAHHLSDKDSLSKASDGLKIYGTEPYQLQFQEPTSHNQPNYYYPAGGSGTGSGSRYSPPVTPERAPPPSHHANRHQYHNERQRTQDRVDYDPFYFSAQQNGVVPSGTRNRRNSKFRDIFLEEPLSNHLLNEDVHFFRRKHHKLSGGLGRHESDASVESIRFNKDSHQRLPLYESSVPYFTSFPAPHTMRQEPFHSSSSLRPTTFDTGHYPRSPYSNYLDVYNGLSHHHAQIPKLYAPGLQRYAREPIDGWSVQVGTQLHVHDDGRERNPAMFYVRDENPTNIRRYPHNYQYIRQ